MSAEEPYFLGQNTTGDSYEHDEGHEGAVLRKLGGVTAALAALTATTGGLYYIFSEVIEHTIGFEHGLSGSTKFFLVFGSAVVGGVSASLSYEKCTNLRR